MRIRIISALALLPVLFFVIIQGGIVTRVALLIVVAISTKEFTAAFNKSGIRPTNVLLYSLSAVLLLPNWTNSWVVLPSLLFVLIFVEAIVLIFGKRNVEDISVSVLTFIYITVALSTVVTIRNASLSFVWYIFIFAFATDTFAYFTGKFIGKTKLMPSISPNKTVEGALGGIVGCVIISGIYAYFVHPDILVPVMIGAIFGGIISQFGDLFASAFKRKLNIKDYGNLIPGHGGMLDRIDSIIFTTPYTYLFFSVMKLL